MSEPTEHLSAVPAGSAQPTGAAQPAVGPGGSDAATAEGPKSRRGNRLGAIVFPLLLAALGLAGAVVAWRVAGASDAAGGESGAGIAAARARTAVVIASEAKIAVALDGWLEYERARRRAEALEAAGYPRTALRDRTVAASNFFLMGGDVQYLDAAGQFDPQRMREALLSEGASREDLDPGPHFAAADAEYDRVRSLVGGGLLIAGALPFLTLAEVTRGRLRGVGAVAGAGLLLAGLLLAITRWG